MAKYKTLMGTHTDVPPSKERQYNIDSYKNGGVLGHPHSAKNKAIEKKKDSYYGSAKQQRDIDKNVAGIHKYNKEHPIKMSH